MNNWVGFKRKKIIRLVAATCIVAGASLTLSAQAEETENIELDTLIVTGELIDRPVSETGTSAIVFDQETLKERPGLFTLRDIMENVPNMSVVTGTGKGPTIRGVDGTGAAENANAFFAGSRPRVNWLIDGRPANFNEVVYGDFAIWDLERIEVLRGPQSTLTGRNSIAGTVVVKTNDPSFKKESAFQLAAGNRDQRRGSAMTNIPVNDQLAVRFAADWYESTSPVNYTPYQGVRHPEEKETLNLRAKMLLKPSVYTNLLLTVSRNEHIEPNGEIVVAPFGDRDSNFPNQPVHETESNNIIAKFESKLTDTLTLEVNASYADLTFKRHAVPNTTNSLVETDQYVFEPSLRYTGQNGLTSVLGVYLFKARQDEFIEFLGGQNFDDKTDTAAIYSETVMPIGEAFEATFGLRYEREKRKRHGGDGAFVQIAQDETYNALLPKFGVTWFPNDDASYGVLVSRGYNAGGGGVAFVFPIVNYQYAPEYVWNYEFFGRQSFANGRLKTTQNLFFTRYKDMQLPFDLTPEDSRDELFTVRNADAVETYGLELGFNYAMNAQFNIYGNLGLLHTEVTDYQNSGIEGNRLLTAPNATASAGVSWQKNNWNASFAARYTSAYYTDVNNRSGGKTDSYVVADAQVAYTFKNFRLFGSVRNLFDSENTVARYPASATSAESAVLQQPRMVLVGLQTTF